jgi:hypothetical protein
MTSAARFWVATALVFAIYFMTLVLIAHATRAAEQTRVYDSRGNSVGTIAPQGGGSFRYYDSRGNSVGTSTTTGNTTKFYSPSGNVTGSAVGPSGPSLPGRAPGRR